MASFFSLCLIYKKDENEYIWRAGKCHANSAPLFSLRSPCHCPVFLEYMKDCFIYVTYVPGSWYISVSSCLMLSLSLRLFGLPPSGPHRLHYNYAQSPIKKRQCWRQSIRDSSCVLCVPHEVCVHAPRSEWRLPHIPGIYIRQGYVHEMKKGKHSFFLVPKIGRGVDENQSRQNRTSMLLRVSFNV